jgi:hypothetical protein
VSAGNTVPAGETVLTGETPGTLLLRPDGYVAWAGGSGADPRPALSRWFGPPL